MNTLQYTHLTLLDIKFGVLSNIYNEANGQIDRRTKKTLNLDHFGDKTTVTTSEDEWRERKIVIEVIIKKDASF